MVCFRVLSIMEVILYCIPIVFFYSSCRLHYMAPTNAGLCQRNMSWCYEVRGPNYHWVVDLYAELNLPVLPAVAQALQKAVEATAANFQKKTADEKANRVKMKVARAEDQEARRKWL